MSCQHREHDRCDVIKRSSQSCSSMRMRKSFSAAETHRPSFCLGPAEKRLRRRLRLLAASDSPSLSTHTPSVSSPSFLITVSLRLSVHRLSLSKTSSSAPSQYMRYFGTHFNNRIKVVWIQKNKMLECVCVIKGDPTQSASESARACT